MPDSKEARIDLHFEVGGDAKSVLDQLARSAGELAEGMGEAGSAADEYRSKLEKAVAAEAERRRLRADVREALGDNQREMESKTAKFMEKQMAEEEKEKARERERTKPYQSRVEEAITAERKRRSEDVEKRRLRRDVGRAFGESEEGEGETTLAARRMIRGAKGVTVGGVAAEALGLDGIFHGLDAMKMRANAADKARKLIKEDESLTDQEKKAKLAKLPGRLSGDMLKLGSGVGQSVIGFATSNLEQMTAQLNLFGDSTKTQTEKLTSFWESLPVIGKLGKSIRELGEAAMGTADAIGAMKEDTAKFHAELQVRSQQEAKKASVEFAVSKSVTEAQVFAAMGGPGALPTARGTYTEELEYARARKRDAAAHNVELANARLEIARKQAGVPDRSLTELRTQEQQLRLKQKGHRESYEEARDYEKGQSWHEYLKESMRTRSKRNMGMRTDLNEEEKTLAELKVNLAAQEAEINRKKEAGLALTQAESAARKALIEDARTELDIAKQKEGLLHGQAQHLGRMDAGQKMLALSAAQEFKSKGWEGLSLTQKRTLASVAPQFAAKHYEREGQNDPTYKALQEIGVFEKGDIKKTASLVDTLERTVRQATHEDSVQTAERVAQVMREWGKEVADQIVKAMEQVKLEFATKVSQTHRGYK